MAGKKFAQVNCSLLRSKKLAECNHGERWVYICAHLTPQGNFAAQFRYPLVLWAIDAGMDPDELSQAIDKLIELGLIEFDHDEEIIRIIGFHRQRPPENASRVISMLNDFSADEAESEQTLAMHLNGVSEFIVAAVKRAQSWKPDSPEWPKLREAFKPFMRQLYQEHGDAFLERLIAEMEGVGSSTRGELISLFPVLECPETTPCPHPADTVPAHVDVDVDVDVDETNTETKTKKKTNTKTAQDFDDFETPNAPKLDKVELLRKGYKPDRSAKSKGPREVTKRSALVVGMGQ